MACRDAKRIMANAAVAKESAAAADETKTTKTTEAVPVKSLLFGVDSRIPADDILQNNLSEFEWVVRNKVYPNFWGRNINGQDCLTKEEINFIHSKGCKIAAIYCDEGEKRTEAQGKVLAKKIDIAAFELGIPDSAAIFLEISDSETATRDFMKGFAQMLISEGYTPGFKANTDAQFTFDREFSRGMQTDRNVFKKCLVWAVAPSLKEYDRVTTTHLIHPDNWVPYAPSGITRDDVAIWQYGKNCHPINDDAGIETTFNVNLVKNDQVIIKKMF